MWGIRERTYELGEAEKCRYIENGNMESAEKRTNDRDGGFTRHSMECKFGIDR